MVQSEKACGHQKESSKQNLFQNKPRPLLVFFDSLKEKTKTKSIFLFFLLPFYFLSSNCSPVSFIGHMVGPY